MKSKFSKTILAAVVIAASISGQALAETGWILAADSAKSDAHFLINVKEFDYKVNDHGTHVFMAPLRIVQAGEVSGGGVAIDAQGCIDGGGEMAMISDDSEKPRHLWWSEDGGRVYDGIAQTVCNVAAEYAKLAAQQEQGGASTRAASSRGVNF